MPNNITPKDDIKVNITQIEGRPYYFEILINYKRVNTKDLTHEQKFKVLACVRGVSDIIQQEWEMSSNDKIITKF